MGTSGNHFANAKRKFNFETGKYTYTADVYNRPPNEAEKRKQYYRNLSRARVAAAKKAKIAEQEAQALALRREQKEHRAAGFKNTQQALDLKKKRQRAEKIKEDGDEVLNTDLLTQYQSNALLDHIRKAKPTRQPKPPNNKKINKLTHAIKPHIHREPGQAKKREIKLGHVCLLYTSDAADE